MTTTLLAPGILTLALFDSGISDLVSQGLRFLAMAGGIVVGWLGGPPVVRGTVRLAFQRALPASALRVSKFGGAILGGLLVYLVPWGLGGSGGGTGAGTGPHSGEETDGRTHARKDTRPKKEKTTTAKPGMNESGTLSIRVLGGNDVKADRYYQTIIEGKQVNLTEAEVRKLIANRLKKNKDLKEVKILVDENKSVLATSDVVTDLVRYCEDLKLAVEVIKVKIIKDQ